MKSAFIIVACIAIGIIIAGILAYKSKDTEDKTEALAECGAGALIFILNIVAGVIFRVF